MYIIPLILASLLIKTAETSTYTQHMLVLQVTDNHQDQHMLCFVLVLVLVYAVFFFFCFFFLQGWMMQGVIRVQQNLNYSTLVLQMLQGVSE